MSSENIQIIELTQTENKLAQADNEPLAKKPRLLSLEECSTSSTCSINSTSSIASTSYFTNETLEAPVIIEKKTENVIILKTYDVINFDVKSLLKNHIIGRAILLKYEKAKCIDNKDRNHLCDIIVCHFLNEGKQLNNATISILAEKIVEIFPEEKKSTYYVSPIGKRKSRYNKPEVAKGKLIDKHRNKWTMLRKTLKCSEISSEVSNKKQGKFKLYIKSLAYVKLYVIKNYFY